MIASDIRKRITGRQWYHQRFDGSPMYLYSIAEAEVAPEPRKPKGTEADVRVSFFQDGKADWYLDLGNIRRGSKKLIELAAKDPQLSSKLLKKWRQDEFNWQKFFDKFNQINFPKLKDQELFKLFKHYRNLGFKRFTSSAIIDHFALGTDDHIAKMLRQEIGQIRRESEFTEIFSIATAPVHQSFINQAEMELLAIAIKKPKDLAAIKRYQQKYYWLKNNYITAQVLSVKHFKREIDLWLQSGADLAAKYYWLIHDYIGNIIDINYVKKEIDLIKDDRENFLRQVREVDERIREIKSILANLSPSLRQQFKVAHRILYLYNERKKEVINKVNIYLRRIIEFSQPHFDIDQIHALYQLMPEEIITFLRKGDFSGWRNRQEAYVYEMVRGKIKKGEKKYLSLVTNNSLRILKGRSASGGKVSGRVCVILNISHIPKFIKDSILVAPFTNVNYLPIMRQAKAIITETGGLTSHAAIVSRELKKPCLVGVRNLIASLRDGDRVEVDANKGIVKKL